ncbi:DNA polymerase epsilon catalytic subunit A [Carpediemonas membranifera]|uniref:DNA-directed DNA polymerase n=1 Tax=Carpediemonas membranifera TaxID=201153 RepID=A0A8J6B5H9_9EUKA|nr:DNA polymerase epsilon catalytic subunit A [Carpediemonas membranifera]|eukprot:KAG9390447.1 DNA polymerase epsilon catalytic subunit A [Carpediemonas membranifera]
MVVETDHCFRGWLLNAVEAEAPAPAEASGNVSALKFLFVKADGNTVVALQRFRPYFLLKVRQNSDRAAATSSLAHEGLTTTDIRLIDTDVANHITSPYQDYIKVEFPTQASLEAKAREIRQQMRRQGADSTIAELREHDVPYLMRSFIAQEIRVGQWYNVTLEPGSAASDSDSIVQKLECLPNVLDKCALRTVAFDIEVAKKPLRFPDARDDEIQMISYMMGKNNAHLIVNNNAVPKNPDPARQIPQTLEFTPSKDFPGVFAVQEVPTEKALLETFFLHMKAYKPHVYVSFNGDFFDWPYIERRAAVYDLETEPDAPGWLERETSIRNAFTDDNRRASEKGTSQGEYYGELTPHLDCFKWVQRDSYLPQGSQNLKAVCREKLRYDPHELDPEEMTPLAHSNPFVYAQYSVSDAVATYYLYVKYVEPFIFSLCTLIPLGPDQVLRKGSGGLCEALLMVQAKRAEVVAPDKQKAQVIKYHSDGRLIDKETYIGGRVEALRSGIYRSDVPVEFDIDTSAYQFLCGKLQADLIHAVVAEENIDVDPEELVKQQGFRDALAHIRESLAAIGGLSVKPDGTVTAAQPRRRFTAKPLIYHLDIAAMYPNIILTNRLQPCSVVTDHDCAQCDFYRDKAQCQKAMNWVWRGLVFKLDAAALLQQKVFVEQTRTGSARDMEDAFKEQVKVAAKSSRGEIHEKIERKREAFICQRDNPFYVDTVRQFRDKRYEFKTNLKVWQGKMRELEGSGDAAAMEQAKQMVVLMDSLQLAHKCILNSFYGYVMAAGSRWYSMEMAGVVTHTGANIIKQARALCERIGLPLELDTDGIWVALPKEFPQYETMKLTDRYGKEKKVRVSYPAIMLNADVYANYTNHQYMTSLNPMNTQFKTHKECSIYFEVDGPYKSMILPASELGPDKLIKKRYAVYNEDNTLAELKGFELKRRGELQLVKAFQTLIFPAFLKGSNVAAAYAEAGVICRTILNVLMTKGCSIPDTELLALIEESTTMSKPVADYGGRKSVAITTVTRLAEIMDPDIVNQTGVTCKYIISRWAPDGEASTTSRAIPTLLWQLPLKAQEKWLLRWTKASIQGEACDIRNIVDWDYYIQRISKQILKIVTIPAIKQGVPNPTPEVTLPDWLIKQQREIEANRHQRKIVDFLKGKSGSITRPPGTFVSASNNSYTNMPLSSGGQKPLSKAQLAKKAEFARQRALNPTKEDVEALKLDPSGRPWRRDTHFPEWIRHKRAQWRALRVDRKQGRLTVSKGTLREFAHKQASKRHAQWTVLQAKVRAPGVVTLAVVMAGTHALSYQDVEVPRVFYVAAPLSVVAAVLGANSSATKLEIVERVLPRHNVQSKVVRVQMAEAEFVNNPRIQSLREHPEVSGVFELGIDPLSRTITQVGGVCRYSGTSAGRTILLDDLHSVRADGLGEVDLEPVIVHYVQHGQRIIATVFSPAFVGERLHFVMSRTNSAQAARDAISEHVEAGEGLYESFKNPLRAAKRHATVTAATSERGTARFIRGRVETLLATVGDTIAKSNDANSADPSSRPRVPVLLVMGPHDRKTVMEALFGVTDTTDGTAPQWPALFMPVDSAWEEEDWADAFGWASAMGVRVAETMASNSGVIEAMEGMARLAGLPLCNLPTDVMSFLADTLYSRTLQANGLVSWCSSTTAPDVGPHPAPVDAVAPLSLSTQGLYRTITASVDIGFACVNAVLYGEAAAAKNITDMVYDAGMADPARRSFQVLRLFIKTCVDQLTASATDPSARVGAQYVTALIEHLYRWISNPQAMLYDPALLARVVEAMNGVHRQLAALIEDHGLTVIHLDFNRVVLDTGMFSVDKAQAVLRRLVDTVNGRNSPFPLLQLVPRSVTLYDALLFVDSLNYIGIGALSGEEIAAQAQPTHTIVGFDFLDVFPQTTAQNLRAIAMNALVVPLHFMWHDLYGRPLDSALVEAVRGSFQGGGQATQAADTLDLDDPEARDPDALVTTDMVKAGLLKAMGRYRSIFYSQLNAARNTIHSLTAAGSEAIAWPSGVPWSRPHDSVESEFVQCSRALVVELDRFMAAQDSDEGARIRAEFTAAIQQAALSTTTRAAPVGADMISVWPRPTTAFILSGLFCDKCNQVYPCDLLGDTKSIAQGGPVCPRESCGYQFSRDKLEARLMEKLTAAFTRFNSTDAVCDNCGAPRMHVVGPNSCLAGCGGKYVPRYGLDQFKADVEPLRRIAGLYGLERLGAAIDIAQHRYVEEEEAESRQTHRDASGRWRARTAEEAKNGPVVAKLVQRAGMSIDSNDNPLNILVPLYAEPGGVSSVKRLLKDTKDRMKGVKGQHRLSNSALIALLDQDSGPQLATPIVEPVPISRVPIVRPALSGDGFVPGKPGLPRDGQMADSANMRMTVARMAVRSRETHLEERAAKINDVKLNSHRNKLWKVVGMLTRVDDGFRLEDTTGWIGVKPDEHTEFGPGVYALGMFVTVQGAVGYDDQGKPVLRPHTITLVDSDAGRTAIGPVPWFEPTPLSAVHADVLNAARDDAVLKGDPTNLRIAFDCLLDTPAQRKRVAHLLRECCENLPRVLVLCGPFSKDEVDWCNGGSALSDAMIRLATLLEAHPPLSAACRDGRTTLVVMMAENIAFPGFRPAPSMPDEILAPVSVAVPTVVNGSNPMRIRVFDKRVVLFSGDLIRQLQADSIQELGGSEAANLRYAIVSQASLVRPGQPVMRDLQHTLDLWPQPDAVIMSSSLRLSFETGVGLFGTSGSFAATGEVGEIDLSRAGRFDFNVMQI